MRNCVVLKNIGEMVLYMRFLVICLYLHIYFSLFCEFLKDLRQKLEILLQNASNARYCKNLSQNMCRYYTLFKFHLIKLLHIDQIHYSQKKALNSSTMTNAILHNFGPPTDTELRFFFKMRLCLRILVIAIRNLINIEQKQLFSFTDIKRNTHE